MVRSDPGPADPGPDPKPGGPPQTADDVRMDIDRGVTGDKVPGSDPAAPPLGTDADAAGTPPTRREIDLEARSRTVLPHTGAPRTHRAPWIIGVDHRGGIIGAGVLLAGLVVLALTMGR